MIDTEKQYCVYLHTIPKSITKYDCDKYYVGITNDINRRWRQKGKMYERQIFYNAIKKYGWDNIKHEILFNNLSKEEAQQKEKEMIIFYNSQIGQNGYNVSEGGENVVDKRLDAKNVYCIDLGMVFRSAKVASQYTNENQNTIRNKCYNYEKGHFHNFTGYKYCYTNHLYKYFYPKSRYDVEIIVDITNGFFNPRRANHRIHKSSIMDINKYIQAKNANKLGTNGNTYMFLKDYLYLFDYAIMSKNP